MRSSNNAAMCVALAAAAIVFCSVTQAKAGFNTGNVILPLSGSAGPTGPDPMFDFSFTDGAGTSVFGTLDAIPNGDGTYTAVSGSATDTSPTYTGALSLIINPNAPNQATSPNGNYFYDNQLLPGQDPLILNGGLLFSTTVPNAEVNIFSNGPGQYQYLDDLGGNVNGAFTLTAVPEPASVTLLGFGAVTLFGYVGLRRRKRTQQA
jgi:PEP-CTERM motif